MPPTLDLEALLARGGGPEARFEGHGVERTGEKGRLAPPNGAARRRLGICIDFSAPGEGPGLLRTLKNH